MIRKLRGNVIMLVSEPEPVYEPGTVVKEAGVPRKKEPYNTEMNTV